MKTGINGSAPYTRRAYYPESMLSKPKHPQTVPYCRNSVKSCSPTEQNTKIAIFPKKSKKNFAILKNRCTFAYPNETDGSLGSLAQLVQSVCLTSRGSGVRLPQLPQETPFYIVERRFFVLRPMNCAGLTAGRIGDGRSLPLRP